MYAATRATCDSLTLNAAYPRCHGGAWYLGGLSPATRAQFDLRRLHPAEAGVLLILCRLQRPGVERSGAQGVRKECPNSSAAACRRPPMVTQRRRQAAALQGGTAVLQLPSRQGPWL